MDALNSRMKIEESGSMKADQLKLSSLNRRKKKKRSKFFKNLGFNRAITIRSNICVTDFQKKRRKKQ